MSPTSYLRRLSVVASVISVSTIACGCNFFKAADPAPTRSITAAGAPTSALVVEVDAADPNTSALLIPLLEATARPHEHLAVMGSGGSAVSSIAPGPASVPAPTPPPPLPLGATTYQQAGHQHELSAYRSGVASARRQAQRETRSRLTAWIQGLPLTSVKNAVAPLDAELAQGGGTLASLAEAGLRVGSRKTLLVLGDGPGSPPSSSPVPGLQGATVIVTNVTGDATVVAEWQAALLATGAARTVVLGPAIVDELTGVTLQGLGGGVSDTLADAGLFPEGSAMLLPQATSPISQLAQLLNVTYPGSTATVIGLGDPVGGASFNDPLSEERAQAVVAALVAMRVSANRLEPVGLGDADPAAPPGPGGVQPRDRRVVVVIEPSG